MGDRLKGRQVQVIIGAVLLGIAARVARGHL
jgi:hypothetical protein